MNDETVDYAKPVGDMLDFFGIKYKDIDTQLDDSGKVIVYTFQMVGNKEDEGRLLTGTYRIEGSGLDTRLSIAFYTCMQLNSYSYVFEYAVNAIGSWLNNNPERNHPLELLLRQELGNNRDKTPKDMVLRNFVRKFNFSTNVDEIYGEKGTLPNDSK